MLMRLICGFLEPLKCSRLSISAMLLHTIELFLGKAKWKVDRNLKFTFSPFKHSKSSFHRLQSFVYETAPDKLWFQKRGRAPSTKGRPEKPANNRSMWGNVSFPFKTENGKTLADRISNNEIGHKNWRWGSYELSSPLATALTPQFPLFVDVLSSKRPSALKFQMITFPTFVIIRVSFHEQSSSEKCNPLRVFPPFRHDTMEPSTFHSSSMPIIEISPRVEWTHKQRKWNETTWFSFGGWKKGKFQSSCVNRVGNFTVDFLWSA